MAYDEVDSDDGHTHSIRKRKSYSATMTERVNNPSDEEQRLHRNAEILRMMPDNIADALAKARYKPVWCSDMRWRMELSRRRNLQFGF